MKKYYRALDHLVMAMKHLEEGNPSEVSASMLSAVAEPDYEDALSALNDLQAENREREVLSSLNSELAADEDLDDSEEVLDNSNDFVSESDEEEIEDNLVDLDSDEENTDEEDALSSDEVVDMDDEENTDEVVDLDDTDEVVDLDVET